jgi:hypothetical protein
MTAAQALPRKILVNNSSVGLTVSDKDEAMVGAGIDWNWIGAVCGQSGGNFNGNLTSGGLRPDCWSSLDMEVVGCLVVASM